MTPINTRKVCLKNRSSRLNGGNERTPIPLYYTLKMYKWKKNKMEIKKRSMITIDYQHRMVNWSEHRGVIAILEVLQDTNPISFCVNEGASSMMLLDLVIELLRDNQNLNTLQTANNLREVINKIENLRGEIKE